MTKGKTKVLYRGKYLQLLNWNTWEYIERIGITGIVIILAVTRDNKIILVEQFRAPLRAKVIELPAGLVGDIKGKENEPLEEAAKRELLEETGYTCSEMTKLTEGPPSPGCTSEMITFLHAKGLDKIDSGGGDDSENITVHEIPVVDINPWLDIMKKKGSLIDPKIFTGLYFLKHNGN